MRLLEAHERARRPGAEHATGPYKANLGPHALLASSPFWRWLGERDLLPPHARPPLSGVRFRWHDEIRRVPGGRRRGRRAAAARPLGAGRPRLPHLGRATRSATEAADQLARSAGILTYHHDPGELSAAFLWEPLVRGLLSAPPTARYPIGGWTRSSSGCAARASSSASRSCTDARVDELPEPPVIVATELRRRPRAARRRHARLAERQRGLPRPRARATGAATRSSSSTSRRPAGSSASPRPTSSLAPDGRGADPGADADPPGRVGRLRRRAARAAARRIVRRLARARDAGAGAR